MGRTSLNLGRPNESVITSYLIFKLLYSLFIVVDSVQVLPTPTRSPRTGVEVFQDHNGVVLTSHRTKQQDVPPQWSNVHNNSNNNVYTIIYPPPQQFSTPIKHSTTNTSTISAPPVHDPPPQYESSTLPTTSQVVCTIICIILFSIVKYSLMAC